MKKIFLIILLLISLPALAQKIQFADTLNGKIILREVSWRYPLPVRLLNFNNLLDTSNIAYLTKDNIFTGTNTTRTLLPNGTRLYNLGSDILYWKDLYVQNLYADTVKKSVVADSLLTTASYKQKSVVTIADSVINCNLSNTFQKTLGANQRFVIENIGDGQTINIAVTNTADNYTVLFVTPTGGLDIKWADATAPTLTLGVKTDIFSFVRIGAVIYGNAIQNF